MTVAIWQCGNCGALFDNRNGGACPCCEGENGIHISYLWIWPGPTKREHVLALAESVDRAARIETLRKLIDVDSEGDENFWDFVTRWLKELEEGR